MIGAKGKFAIISVVGYLFLLISFYKVLLRNENDSKAKDCNADRPCIRFCSSESDLISDNELFSQFVNATPKIFDYRNKNENEISAYDSYDRKFYYRVFRGAPKCEILSLIENPVESKFSYQSVRFNYFINFI